MLYKTFKTKVMKHLIIIIAMLPAFFVMACGKHVASKDEREEENERAIKISELPQSVKDGIEKKYSGAELIEADEITHRDGSLTYDIEIKHNGSAMEVMFDDRGAYLGVEIDDEDPEGDEEENDD